MIVGLLFQGLVLLHFLFEIGEGRLEIKKAGFEGDADISALVVEDAVEKAAALV